MTTSKRPPAPEAERDSDGGAIDDPPSGLLDERPATDRAPGRDPGDDPRRDTPDGPPPEMAEVVEGPIGSAQLTGPRPED